MASALYRQSSSAGPPSTFPSGYHPSQRCKRLGPSRFQIGVPGCSKARAPMHAYQSEAMMVCSSTRCCDSLRGQTHSPGSCWQAVNQRASVRLLLPEPGYRCDSLKRSARPLCRAFFVVMRHMVVTQSKNDHMENVQIISKAEAKACGYKRYFTGKPCLHGHTSERSVYNSRCLACDRETQVKRRASNAAAYRERDKARHQANRDCRNLNQRARRAANVEKIRERDRAYYKKNADVIREQKRANRHARSDEIKARKRQRNQADAVFAFNHRVRSLIRNALISKGFRKLKRTEEILGCSISEFKDQIERQFLPGMSWSNRGDWEIDHIIPASLATSQAEAESLNRAGNLRPIWAKDNRSKSASVLFLL